MTADFCTVDKCLGSAIEVDGGGGTDASISDWNILNCKVGIKVCSGRLYSQLCRNKFTNCSLDIYIAPDATGSVDITEYAHTPEDVKYINLSQPIVYIAVYFSFELTSAELRVMYHVTTVAK